MFVLTMLVALFLCLSGILIAFVLGADHIAEFLNKRNYQNEWEPFRGAFGFFDYVARIPDEIVNGIRYFPDACFAMLVFYPLTVIILALFEVFEGDFTMLLMGWLPFFAGIMLFVIGGFFFLREPVGSSFKNKND
ncbi:MAG: hypothetical protein WBK77_06165 [Alphaproteobacteria bacterium]